MPYKPDLKLVHCPFNKQHIFTSDRLQPHIIKCGKNYPNHYTCPFYNLHRFLKKDEYDLHLFTCDRKAFLIPMSEEKFNGHGLVKPAVNNYDPRIHDVTDEDWESEYQNRN